MDKAFQDFIKRQRETEDLVAGFSKAGTISDSLQKSLSSNSIASFLADEKSRSAISSVVAQAESAKLEASKILKYSNPVVPSFISEAAKMRESFLSKDLIALSTSSHFKSIAEFASKHKFEIGSAYKHIDIGSTVSNAMIGDAIARLAPALSTAFLASHALDQFKDLSKVLQVRHGFGESISKTLRDSLGDWRGQLVVPRSPQHMYVEHGFDRGLTDYPSELFFEVVSEAGLADSSNDIGLFGPVINDSDDGNLSQLELNTRSYARLYQLENRLRSFINNAMTAKYGKGWVKVLTVDVKDNLHEIQEKKKAKGEERTLIECTDFSHYVKIDLAPVFQDTDYSQCSVCSI
jgi:hypothetical protein